MGWMESIGSHSVISVKMDIYPTWKIECKKRQDHSDLKAIESIVDQFSIAYENANYDDLANFYAEDGKIFPIRSNIISGREAIKKKWTLPEGVRVLDHNITPSEIKVVGNLAYDYGYYDGINLNKEKKQIPFKGKYVIVWKKINEEWKIYLDIWNRIE
jgi:ketosteroid isomerase-like protein